MTPDRPPLRRGELRELLLTPGGPLAKVEVVEAVGSTSTAVADELRADLRRADAGPGVGTLTVDTVRTVLDQALRAVRGTLPR